jgi:uncharacterized membrane protein
MMDDATQAKRVKTSGLLFGIGLGGFFDGIVLHQILQWHHMGSHVDDYPMTTVAGLEANTLADGLFHAFTYLVTIIALVTLWPVLNQPRRVWSTRGFIGLLMIGWALFNIVEGVVDHHLLKVHVVREDVSNTEVWNWGFLILSVLLLAIGYAVYRGAAWDSSHHEPSAPGSWAA